MLPKRIPLTGTAGDDFFVRQQDDYSCGPASLATAANIYGAGIDYKTIRDIVNPDPAIGTAQEKIAEVAEKILPFAAAGESTYKGGVAVANIVQEGEGHYVVFLAREKDRVIYYEPYYHELVIDDINNIEWHSGDGKFAKWAADRAPLDGNSIDFWLKYAEPKTPAPHAQKKATPKPPVP